MEKMRLTDRYREIDAEQAEWLNDYYGHLANFTGRCVEAKLAAGADGCCIWVRFPKSGTTEVLIPLTRDHYENVVDVIDRYEDNMSYEDMCSFCGVSPDEFI